MALTNKQAIYGMIGMLGLGIVALFLTCIPENKELARVTSPSGKWDAVLVETIGGGATVGPIWFVDVVPQGKKDLSADRASLTHLEGPTNLAWESPSTITLQYARARIDRSESTFVVRSRDAAPDSLRLKLRGSGLVL